MRHAYKFAREWRILRIPITRYSCTTTWIHFSVPVPPMYYVVRSSSLLLRLIAHQNTISFFNLYIYIYICFCIRCFWHIIFPSKVFHSIRPISAYGSFWYNNDLSASLNIRCVKTQTRAPSRKSTANFGTANIDTVPTRFSCHLISCLPQTWGSARQAGRRWHVAESKLIK